MAEAEAAIAYAAQASERAAAAARTAAYLEQQRGRAAAQDGVVSLEEVTSGQRLLDDKIERSDAATKKPRAPSSTCTRICAAISDNPSFQHFVIGLIVLNTIAMSLESYPMDPTLEKELDNLNVVFTLAFAGEMVLKLGAEGLSQYLSDAFNRFDGLVVIVSVADLIVSYMHIDIGLNVSVLRAARLLRIFRLVRSWRNLRIVLQAMLNAVGQLSNLFILLLLIIFIFALLGMSLFGGVYTPENGWDEPPRTNFDSMIGSMLTVSARMPCLGQPHTSTNQP